MRFIWVYLTVYSALLAGAFVALTVGGVLPRLSFLTILVAFGGAIALGILLAVVWLWQPGNAVGGDPK